MTIRNKRILRDIKDVMTDNSMDNIYYSYDDNEIGIGYALIYVIEGTPYAYGSYLFKIEFPMSYPYEPPIVTFMTGDGVTRFHPNFYVDGMVCLSILNTWPGERWSACQSLSSVLLNVSSLFDSKPLLYEPGVSNRHIDFDKYNDIISYKNIDIAILKYLDIDNIPEHFRRYHTLIKSLYNKNKDSIIHNATKHDTEIRVIIYGNMSCICNYSKLLDIIKLNK